MRKINPLVDQCLLEVQTKMEQGIVNISNSKVLMSTMLGEYNKLEKKLEDLPELEKQTMWEEVKTMFPDKSHNDRVDICKLIHCCIVKLT